MVSSPRGHKNEDPAYIDFGDSPFGMVSSPRVGTKITEWKKNKKNEKSEKGKQ